MEQAHTYTILGRGMSGLVLAETSGARSLEDACNLTFYCTVPVAWFEGDKEVVGNLDDDQDLRERVLAECIAAGRVIEMVDGQYVPRGVPVETKPAATLGDQLRKVLERGKPTPTLDKLENEAEKKEEPQHNGAELIRRWAEKERARMQKERDEMLMPVGPNDAMIARDCTEAACLYAEQRQEAERVRATLSATKSTAKPALAALSRISSMSHMLGNGIKG